MQDVEGRIVRILARWPGLGVRGSYVCVPWLINSLCTPPLSFAKSSEITGQDTGVRRQKFLCSSSPSPASCVRECERVPGRSQQNAWGRQIRLGTESAVWGKRWREDDGELHPSSIYLKVTHPLGALEGINSSNTVANWMFWIRCCSVKNSRFGASVSPNSATKLWNRPK